MIKINQNIKARQKSEIAIIVFFEGGVNRGGRYEWHPKTHGSLWSEPFRTKELAVQNAIDHGYYIVKDSDGNTLVNKNN